MGCGAPLRGGGAYQDWLRRTEASMPIGVKLRRTLSQLYRSKGERQQIADYYAADFTIEVDAVISPAQADPRQSMPRRQPSDFDSEVSLAREGGAADVDRFHAKDS